MLVWQGAGRVQSLPEAPGAAMGLGTGSSAVPTLGAYAGLALLLTSLSSTPAS